MGLSLKLKTWVFSLQGTQTLCCALRHRGSGGKDVAHQVSTGEPPVVSWIKGWLSPTSDPDAYFHIACELRCLFVCFCFLTFEVVGKKPKGEYYFARYNIVVQSLSQILSDCVNELEFQLARIFHSVFLILPCLPFPLSSPFFSVLC